MSRRTEESQTFKVCHLTCAHGAYDVRIFQKECVSLAQAGYQVTCIGLADSDAEVNGVRVLGIPKPRRFMGRVTFDILTRTTARLLRLGLQEKADLYHFHDPHLIPAGLILKCLGKKVVYDVHEYEPGRISAGFREGKIRRAVAFIVDKAQCFAARGFDGIVAATPFICEQFKSRGIRVITANNYPLMSEIISKSSDRAPNSLKPLVAYVGFISRIRGIIETIRALEHTDAGLILCGRFASADLQKECEDLRGWQKVQFLGQIDRVKMGEVLHSVRAGVVPFLPHPNHFEARPNKIFEYMGAGLPVVASNFPDWKNLIEGNACGYCADPENPAQLGGVIQTIVDNPAKAFDMGERGRELVMKEFNWGAEEKRLAEFYDFLLAPAKHDMVKI